MNSVLSEARSCLYPSEARGEEVGVSQAGMWGLEEKLFASPVLVWESKKKHPTSTVFCQVQDGVVSLGSERCRGVFLGGDPCSQQRAGGEWAGGKVMSVCLQGVPNQLCCQALNSRQKLPV